MDAAIYCPSWSEVVAFKETECDWLVLDVADYSTELTGVSKTLPREKMEDCIGLNKDATINKKFEVNIKDPIRKGNGGFCEIDEFGVEKLKSDVVINILNLKEGRIDDISLGSNAEISEDIYINCEGYNLPKFEELVRQMSW